MSVRKILILAKSAKNNNYCIAGLDIETNKWVRPVSTDPKIEEAVPPEDIICTNNMPVELLDVVEINFVDYYFNLNPFQPENLYYDSNCKWKKLSHVVNIQNVLNFHGFDDRDKIFYNFDRAIPSEDIKDMPSSNRESLLLLRAERLFIQVAIYRDYPKFYLHFKYNEKHYRRFSVGDISIRDKFRDRGEGTFFLAHSAIVVFSLTNPFHRDSKCYKMIAQIF